jgi:Tol biopolymer transport system component
MFDENYQQQHLWSVAVANKPEHRITEGSYSVIAYQLSPDGRRIALHRSTTPLLENNDESEVWVMDASGAGARQITHNKIPETGAAISPDGSQVLFVAGANSKFETYYNNKLFVAPVAGGDSRVLIPDLPYEVERAAWSKDGKSIFFLANMGVHAELFQFDLQGKPKQLTDGKHTIAAWTFEDAANQHVFTEAEPSVPAKSGYWRMPPARRPIA